MPLIPDIDDFEERAALMEYEGGLWEQGYLQRLSEWEEATGKEVRSFRFSL